MNGCFGTNDFRTSCRLQVYANGLTFKFQTENLLSLEGDSTFINITGSKVKLDHKCDLCLEGTELQWLYLLFFCIKLVVTS